MKPILCSVYGALMIYSVLLHRELSGNYPDIKKFMIQLSDSVEKIKDLRMQIYALERQEKKDEFRASFSQVKIKYGDKKKIYFKNPEKGLEILYDPSVSSRALVKHNSFPYVPLWLDTQGSIMRKNQHYTIHELGFDFILKSIQMTILKDREFYQHARWTAEVKRNGCDCMVLVYENPQFRYVEYTVGEKEDLDILCLRMCVNHYLVRIKNGLYNEYKMVKKNTRIQIPNLYARKAVIYFDKKTFLPVVVSLYDDIGMFEHYEYTHIRMNTCIPDAEFTRTYPEYKF